jgi:hypothetical protein
MGPKKGGGNRGGPKKSAKPQQEEVSISDFLAAGESKDGKPKTKGDAGKGKQRDTGGDAASEQAKKPSVRSVIGGASWTGKLPVNMLSEHCQKQKWEKPEYTMVAMRYLSSVLLSVLTDDIVQSPRWLHVQRDSEKGLPKGKRDYYSASDETSAIP